MKDKVVLITGASSGIGRACAVAFAKKGASLVITARSKDKLQKTNELIKNFAPRVLRIQTDVTNRMEIRDLFQKIKDKLGRLDILINNAGTGLSGSVENLITGKVDYIFKLNFFAPLWCIQEALPIMRIQKGGQIINVSSIAGKRGFPLMGGYCASKFALNGLTESLRVEFKKNNIHVLLVCPAGTNTSFNSETMKFSDNNDNTILKDNNLLSSDYVASQILKAANKKKREIIVGPKGKAILFLNWLSAGLTDRLLAKMCGF